MADIPARTELPESGAFNGRKAAKLSVTTGPIRGSRKIHVGNLGVAMRAVDLESSSGEPPGVLYDTSGPYTRPERRSDGTGGR